MDHVAGYDGVVTFLADPHRIMVDRMPGRRDEVHVVVDDMVAFDDVAALGLDDRQHGIGDPRAGGGIG